MRFFAISTPTPWQPTIKTSSFMSAPTASMPIAAIKRLQARQERYSCIIKQVSAQFIPQAVHSLRIRFQGAIRAHFHCASDAWVFLQNVLHIWCGLPFCANNRAPSICRIQMNSAERNHHHTGTG